ncbi:MAG: transposase [Planctomycetes bacterium]|nr:transposase [Planctomycetota bacterium]
MKDELYKTMWHFFPSFSNWLNDIEDPREKKKIEYPLSSLTWVGILLFLMKLETRRQIKFQFNTNEFIGNINLLAKSEIEQMAHPDTLGYLLKRLHPEGLSDVRVKMVSRLIRMRNLERYRLLGEYYLISIDGTGHLVFNRRHCERCLVKKKDDKVLYYYHNVLEAKLVTANGLALSIETEFIENTDEDMEKQDCELRAFYRLVENLKRNFPQLNICLLLDALYAAKPVFDICKKYDWKYLITFKRGSMSAVYEEYIALKSLQRENAAQIRDDEIEQNYNWVRELDYEGRPLNIVECNEIKEGKNGKIEDTKFVWLTNLKVEQYNYKQIAKAGRLRWKTENEGFNIQKNGGYNLEHPYSHDEVACKNFYLLLQIAHTINQLMEKGSLLKDQIQKVFGNIRNIARRLLEDFRTKSTTKEQLQSLLSVPFQIRFDSS